MMLVALDNLVWSGSICINDLSNSLNLSKDEVPEQITSIFYMFAHINMH